MDKKFYRIDELSRGSLGNLEKDPPPMSFDKIRKRVFWYSLWSLSIGSFLRRFWSIPAAAALVAVILYQIPSAKTSDLPGIHAIAESMNIPAIQKPNTNLPEQSDISYYNQNNNNATSNTHLKNNGQKTTIGNDPAKDIKEISGTDNNNTLSNPESTLNSETHPDKSMNPAQNHEITKTAAENPITATTQTSEALPAPGKISLRFDMILCPEQISAQHVSDVKTNFADRIINWSVYISAGTGYSGSMFTPVSENQPDIKRDLSLSTHFSLESRADFGKWFIAAGLNQFSIDNHYSSDYLLYNSRTENVQHLTNQFWMTDSTGYWHYTYVSDTIIHVLDSVWAWNIDSVLVQEFDTVSVAKSDTLGNARWKRNAKYLELPFTVGKTFSVNRFMFGLSGGFGIGILYFTEGEYYPGNGNSTAFTAITPAESKKISLSFMAAGSVSYLLNEQWAIEFSPWYKKMLTPVFPGEWQGAQKPWTAGLSAGLRYYF